MDDEDYIAWWKINELERTFSRIENLKFFEIIRLVLSEPATSWKQKWDTIHPLLLTLNISIRKPPERITEEDLLEGQELLKRWNRSCGNAVCQKKHCTECGTCGHTISTEHDCVRPSQ